MLRRLSPILFAALAVAGACSETPAPVPPVVVVVPPATASAPAAAPAGSATPAPVASATAVPSADPAPDHAYHRVEMVLRPGDPPCAFGFDAGLFTEEPDTLIMAGVSRVVTEASGGCAAGLVYDVTKETRAQPNDPDPDTLELGPFVKAGHTKPADFDEGGTLVTDLNFDGYADLCLVEMTGNYNYTQHCFLFDPARKVFVREKALDAVTFPRIDAKKKRLSTSYRVAGRTYYKADHGWEKGKLVMLREVMTTLGETPDGKPLPSGFDHWEARWERRGGRRVKAFEGPVRGAP